MTDKTSVMAKESGIFEKEFFLQKDSDNFHDYKLLKTTAYSKLWRVSRDGGDCDGIYRRPDFRRIPFRETIAEDKTENLR